MSRLPMSGLPMSRLPMSRLPMSRLPMSKLQCDWGIALDDWNNESPAIAPVSMIR